MAKNDNKTYWPHMILGFLSIGIILGFWTIKSAINTPVNESNEYQLSYQMADMNINKIIEAQKLFDSKYIVKPIGFKKSSFEPKGFLKRKHGEIIALNKNNTISYEIKSLSGSKIDDANVTFLLTRPQTRNDDQEFKDIKGNAGVYTIKNLHLKKAGRYILRLRAQIGDAVSFVEYEAYLKP